jgi:hypothetical protein
MLALMFFFQESIKFFVMHAALITSSLIRSEWLLESIPKMSLNSSVSLVRNAWIRKGLEFWTFSDFGKPKLYAFIIQKIHKKSKYGKDIILFLILLDC